MRLSGKVAIVTGGASGIGKATVRRLVTDGAAVVIADVNPTSGEALARDIQADGRDAVFIATDVTLEESVAGLIDQTVAHYGQLDVMFNNAGIGQHLVKDEATWWRLVQINLTGVFLGMKHATRVMRPRHTGSIISTASHAGTRGARGNIYGATKAGVIALTNHVAVAVVHDGIRANTVSPGNVETPFSDPRRGALLERLWQGDSAAFADDPVISGAPRPNAEEHQRRLDAMHPTGRRAMPDDIARSVAFLASDESSFVNGHNLMTTGLVRPPQMIDRVLMSRARAVAAPSLGSLDGKLVAIATENAGIGAALANQFETCGARVHMLALQGCTTGSDVAGILDRIRGDEQFAAVIFALRPDPGGDLFTTSVEAWTDEVRANLFLPTALVESAMERMVPGGSVLLITDTAGVWGGPGSPGYCTTAAALGFHTEYWATHALNHGVRINSMTIEDLSHITPVPGFGGPASAQEVAALVRDIIVELPGMTGLQLDLSTTHP